MSCRDTIEFNRAQNLKEDKKFYDFSCCFASKQRHDIESTSYSPIQALLANSRRYHNIKFVSSAMLSSSSPTEHVTEGFKTLLLQADL